MGTINIVNIRSPRVYIKLDRAKTSRLEFNLKVRVSKLIIVIGSHPVKWKAMFVNIAKPDSRPFGFIIGLFGISLTIYAVSENNGNQQVSD